MSKTNRRTVQIGRKSNQSQAGAQEAAKPETAKADELQVAPNVEPRGHKATVVTLDEARPYALVRGASRHRYLQDGKYFDAKKEHSGDAPAAFSKPAPAGRSAPRPAQKSRQDVISDLADKLEGGRAGAPSSVQDARKENAAAAAAEENAG